MIDHGIKIYWSLDIIIQLCSFNLELAAKNVGRACRQNTGTQQSHVFFCAHHRRELSIVVAKTIHSPIMSMFRAKKLDLGCFVKARTIRDHTKRKVFEEFETERYVVLAVP